MRYRLKISADAADDIRRAYDFIERYSPVAATRWREGLFERLSILTDSPQRWPLAPEADAFKEPIRQLLYGKRRHVYRILYRVDDAGGFVEIAYVRHSARDQVRP
jgi:plasmid stabilization system protein ParE